MEPMNPMMGGMMPQPERKRSKLWVVILVVVILLAALAWYYYSYYYVAVPSEDATTRALETQSSSDEIADIERDLNATALDGLDSELSDIGAELDQ